MSFWFRKVTQDISEITNCIEFFESELEKARFELTLKNKSIEKHASELPGIVEHRFGQLQEIEAILEFLNIELNKTKSFKFKEFLEKYNRALTSRDAEKYAEGDLEVVELAHIVNEFALLRNKYLGLLKGIDNKQWQITNIVKLRVAGMEDASID